MKFYVGNMSYSTTEDGLRTAFAQYGEVEEVLIITDRDTGRPRGFAFVTMPDNAEAQAAIAALNGQNLDGRTLNVNEARARPVAAAVAVAAAVVVAGGVAAAAGARAAGTAGSPSFLLLIRATPSCCAAGVSEPLAFVGVGATCVRNLVSDEPKRAQGFERLFVCLVGHEIIDAAPSHHRLGAAFLWGRQGQRGASGPAASRSGDFADGVEISNRRAPRDRSCRTGRRVGDVLRGGVEPHRRARRHGRTDPDIPSRRDHAALGVGSRAGDDGPADGRDAPGCRTAERLAGSPRR